MDLGLSGILLLGLVIGLQHALEADHVAAVSSMVSGETSVKRIVWHGALWGTGHALMLAAVAGTIIYMGATLNEQIAGWLEFAVGVMLVGLGVNVIWRLVRERIHFHAHKHDDGTLHLHAHSHAGDTVPHAENAHAHEHPESLPWRTLFVGLMHGMAGSAALLVLAASAIDDPLHSILYVVVFGIGSIVGMAALSVVIAVPIGYTAKSLTWAHHFLRGGIGVLTTMLGFVVMYETQLAQLWAGV